MALRQHRTLIVVVAVLAALILLIATALTWVAAWAPIFHISCARGGEVVGEQLWTPVVLANSPYGGQVYDNGTIPPYVPGSPGYPNAWSTLGAPSKNGTASGAFIITNITIFATTNATVWGPGSNVHCDHPYEYDFVPTYGVGGGVTQYGPIATPIPMSDQDEATTATFGTPPFLFQNEFSFANHANVSTCSGAAKWDPVSSPDFTAWAPPVFGESGNFIPVVLPFAATFEYYFPPNFGTWAIDNLSAPGGPGGGWAFDFLGPCT